MSPLETTPLLLVEDNDDDLFFFRRVLAKAGITGPTAVATDGRLAIDHLAATLGAAPDRPPVPRIVFLDLKLPLRNGFEVLEWIRAQPALAATVAIILSSSGEARDVEQAYRLGAEGYLVKYPEPAVFREILQRVADAPADPASRRLALPGLPRP